MLRILGRRSSINVRKALWAAAEAEVAFAHEDEWAGARDTHSPNFLALNPNGLVPVLVTDEGVLWESNTICRFLAAIADRKDLLPDVPFARAEVEKWMDWQATELNTAWRPAFMALVRNSPHAEPAMVQRSIEEWNALMLLLDERLRETNAYVTGPNFTLADVVLGLSVQRWLLTPMPRPPASALLTYRQRLQTRPAALAWVDPNTP
jgi:glutathione S-transferase